MCFANAYVFPQGVYVSTRSSEYKGWSRRKCLILAGPRPLIVIQEFSRLQDWPKLARTFRKLVQSTTDGCPEFRAFPNPVFTLMHMAARNGVATKYLAIEENFLLTAIHVAALKNFPFAEGALPDLPANMPSAPLGCVFSLSSSSQMLIQVMLIQAAVSKIKSPMIASKLNSMHS